METPTPGGPGKPTGSNHDRAPPSGATRPATTGRSGTRVLRHVFGGEGEHIAYLASFEVDHAHALPGGQSCRPCLPGGDDCAPHGCYGFHATKATIGPPYKAMEIHPAFLPKAG